MHGAVASLEKDAEWTAAALADHRTAPIGDKLRATLDLLAKVTTDHAAVNADDVRAVLATGVSRKGVEDALFVAAMFNAIARLADAFGFAMPSPSGVGKAAKSLLRFGYEL